MDLIKIRSHVVNKFRYMNKALENFQCNTVKVWSSIKMPIRFNKQIV